MQNETNQGKENTYSLGLDVGALFVKAALIGPDGEINQSVSRAHKGEIFKITHEIVTSLMDGHELGGVGIVGKNAEMVADALDMPVVNDVAASMVAVGSQVSDIRHIIDIGGGSLSMTDVGEDGIFGGYQTNTLCAAGTGSFLDEQAARLGIAYEDLEKMAVVQDPPSVAARCAVFAKSDLIHRQQEGYSKPEMWSGLCKGLVRTIVMTLFKGRQPVGKTVVIGGVARNREVMRWLTDDLAVEVVHLESPQEMGAIGAAKLAEPLEKAIDWSILLTEDKGAEEEVKRKPLELHKSDYPSFEVEEYYIDEEANEVRVSQWPASGNLRGYIGIDIGSTSTKLLMIDENEEALVDIYRKTGGDPINATKSLFRALRTLVQKRGGTIDVLGSGTTGSGRKLVGAVIGADRVINEITAHVTGAMKTDPSIDTIFEIGGQDAKYIHTVNGNLHNSNMNYVCAAGTGSFVEEVSRKLGFDIFTLGDEVMGVVAPITSDRCTVFMEQDAQLLLRKGYSKREVMAAVMYSVVQNYLRKVVGSRYHSKTKVFFQGATARNKGLVAAFENLLDVEVVVSPYCHVMGSWGVALLTKRQMEAENEITRFVGLSFAEKEVRLSQEDCELCANRCAITYADVDGLSQRPSWGYLCGRDAEDTRVRVNKEFSMFRLRDRLWNQTGGEVELPKNAPVIGMPRALLAHSYYPLWRRFFAELGYNLKLSKKTDAEINHLASDWVGSDYCHPVKLAHGHARQLLEQEGVELMFSPHMVSAGDDSGKTTESFFCPYNIALPAMLGSAMGLNGISEARLLRATLDLRWDDKKTAERLYQDLGKRLGKNKRAITAAWKAAISKQREFEDAMKTQGRAMVDDLLTSGRPAIVILGRAYNVFDPGANLSLPEKIARLGFPVVPLDFLPIDEEDIGDEFHNMYWNYGRKIIEAVRFISRTPNLYGVYFSNFSCGPDSFIQTYAEAIMGEKPMLMLELDEHGADAGYLTRLEAFADVVAVNKTHTVDPYRFTRPPTSREALSTRTLWVPPMGEGPPELMAAALRSSGVNAKTLPVETKEAFQLGRDATRGGECVPCPATLGTFFATVNAEGGDPNDHALFMPTAEGPCRFGQYCTLDRMAFDKKGWTDMPVVSWSSTDSYDGTDEATRRKLWQGIVLGDVLFKARCRTVPYEIEEGQTEEVWRKWIDKVAEAMVSGSDMKMVVEAARKEFMAIPKRQETKPLVGIVGEIYVRSNRYTNQDVVRRIEKAGGEAWLAPISEWVLYTAYMEGWMQGYRTLSVMDRFGALLKNRFMAKDEKMWVDAFSPILDKRHEPSIPDTLESGKRFVPLDFEGEVILTLGRAIEYMKDGADLVVNCAPFGCMPGAITSGVLQQVQKEYSIPVANMFYDGEGDINGIIDTYIANIRHAKRPEGNHPRPFNQRSASAEKK